ncbi:ABC transporter family substrate-binding protein [Kitasatospora purpeofusca]|uniref:ABC transporter family substrate-binding protein n=1 Tax=Kitasatospora purpeofusca TaxID=67352 RepID=UPI0022521F03|nr:ABC transporter family substrate-binding protein [Kitasatospora purpeofusca]MCX4752865.1 ABC transporter family substrate-binding protein [Kitasatospora purpeofusca]WSR32413.1 ABC transporter family substrate-binding protein [Kitasatospora purpeofusca]
MHASATPARRLGRAAVLALAVALAATACSSGGGGSADTAVKSAAPGQGSIDINARTVDQIRDGGEVRFPLYQWITQWNPFQVDGRYGDAVEIMRTVEPDLFTTDETGTFKANADYLVDAKVTSTSPQVVTYKLNPKAKWSDGKPLSYLDFKADWEASNGKKDGYNIADSAGYELISGVEQGADPAEVKVTFSETYADWQNLFRPLIPAAGIATADDFNKGWVEKVPITAGALKIGTADKTAQTLTLVPDPNWWGAKPKAERIVFRVMSQSATTQAFLNNEIDYATAGTATAYGQLKDAKDAVIRSASPWDEVHISFGGGGALADRKVRQALGKALDRSALIKIANNGVPVEFKPLGNHIFMPNQAGYQDNSGEWAKFDVPAAKKLLDDAGWKEAGSGQPRTKDGQSLTLHWVLNESTPQAQVDLATAAQAMWLQAGVKVEVDKVAANDFFTKYVNPGKWDIASWRNTDSFPLSSSLTNFRLPQGDNVFGNFSKLGTEEIDGLLKKAAGTIDPVEAAKLYNQADAKIWELGHTFELYQRPTVVAARKGLANYGAFGLASTDYTKVGWEK